MKIQQTTRIALILAPLWLYASETGLAAAQEEAVEEHWQRRFDIGPEGSLSLSNVAGDILVQGSGTDQVEIEATKHVRRAASETDAKRQLESVDIEVTHRDNRLRIHTRYDRAGGRHAHTHVSVDYRVSVPRGTEVTLKSVSGDVEAKDVDGELSVESVSGTVRVSNVSRLIMAKSVSGSVEVESAKGSGELELSSVSGDVNVQGLAASRCELTSTSGDIDVTAASCERATFKTVSGEVRYIGTLARGGRYEFKSHSGHVRIGVEGDVGFELEAESFSGTIESDFALTVHSARGKRHELVGVYGDGSAYIEATTFSGDVTIEKTTRARH